MDNPQHYQPLSHALHPPLGSPHLHAPSAYSATDMYRLPKPIHHEEEDASDDEGAVHEQLAPHDTSSNPPSPHAQSGGLAENSAQQETETKRRPGRPRGSKNRKSRVPGVGNPSTSKTSNPQQQNPPQLPEVNASNQQYYEFQWRVLNLCAEFYGAAEELVKATHPLVIAQCYQMGPSSKVDPINMLNEAKRNCDTLLANPSQLISIPPPPMYPPVPSIYQSPQPVGATAAASAPPTVINQPQSFVVSMGAPPPQYPVYTHPPTTQYTPTSYYQHPYTAPYYAPAPNATQSASTAQPTASGSGSGSGSSTVVTNNVTGIAGNSGAWSDEETDRLRKLADEGKAKGFTGDAMWDWVVNQWGKSRSRHQILIKATQMGLKESTATRGVKRRRETEAGEAVSPPAPPPPAAVAASSATATSSPAQSAAASTPAPSPSIQHQARPPSSSKPTSTPAPTTTNLPWPMPTVAANTPSIIPPSTNNDRRSTSYYRPRPSDASSKPLSGPPHSYMYQANGRSDSGK
ncbi:hypothetical protein Moror_12360 [Moniliophthora roreri MCA 2997]|uniref:Myb-like domain-containing protein n=2 Tax=Moniliophthora roreri TaxID=221103 RepID=V2XQ52_MONRO|nr:hypothetical protein Moror_12360 [Moniliophthora roreri MCA 2997]KAI3615888.1 hypothetical protein WG66_010212 [Moniliophthora roreri]